MDEGPEFGQSDKSAFVAPLTAGSCVQLFLFGVVIHVYWTFAFSPAGRATSSYNRLAFWATFILAAVQTAFLVKDVMWYTTIATDSVTVLLQGSGFLQHMESVVGAVQAGLVQVVLALRAFKVVQRPLVRYALLVGFGSLIVLETLAGVMVALGSFRIQDGNFHAKFPLNFGIGVAIWMWLAAAVDSIITGSYIYLIYDKLKDGNDTTRSVFSLIAQGTLQSAAYTTIVAIITAISVSALGSDNIQTADISYSLWLCLPSLYALSLISTLSIGDRVVARMQEKNEQSIAITVNRVSMIQVDDETPVRINGDDPTRYSGKRRKGADLLSPQRLQV